jgi:hypothetical protein
MSLCDKMAAHLIGSTRAWLTNSDAVLTSRDDSVRTLFSLRLPGS